jgi:hypothetical protein
MAPADDRSISSLIPVKTPLREASHAHRHDEVRVLGSSHIPYVERPLPYGSLTAAGLPWNRRGTKGVRMLDVVMIALTILSFVALFAFVAWLERV